MMITIYRVENDKGRGFYHDGFYGNFPPVQYWYPIFRFCSRDVKECFLDSIHPRVNKEHDELVYADHSDWVFGFATESDMHRWFPYFVLNHVPRFKGKILKYQVDDQHVKFLKSQCLFNVKEANIVGEHFVLPEKNLDYPAWF